MIAEIFRLREKENLWEAMQNIGTGRLRCGTFRLDAIEGPVFAKADLKTGARFWIRFWVNGKLFGVILLCDGRGELAQVDGD